MAPRTVTLVSIPVLAIGLASVASASWKLHRLDDEAARLAEAGRAAGASFVETLRGEDATRLLASMDRRHALMLERAAARRDRLLGLVAAVAGLVGLGAARSLRRLAREIEEAEEPPPGQVPGAD